MLDKDLFKLIKQKKHIFSVVIISILSMLVNIGITACVCIAVRMAYYKSPISNFIILAVVVALCLVMRGVLSKVAGTLKNNLGAEIKKDLRQRTYDKIVDLGVRSTDNMSMAGLTQVSMEGIEQLDLYYSSYLPQFFYSMIAPLILFVIGVFIDWRTSLVLLACVPLIPVSIVAVSKYAKKIFAKYWGKYTSMGDGFLDSIQGMKELKIFGADEKYNKKMNAKAEEFRKITMKVLVMQLASTTIMDLVAFGGAGAGIAVAIWGVMARGLSPFMALFLILIAVEFFLPLRALGSAFHIAMNGASAGKKIYALLNTPSPEWGDQKVEEDSLEIQNLSFSYDKKRNILDDINMSFGKGMTAIVGESGSGKSTIVSLLTGAIKPDKGRVSVGGKELSTLDRQDYYSHLCVVNYNTYIFNTSILENFRLAKPDVEEGQIWQALAKVNLDGFVRENGGIDKTISEDGNNISGGQKQRLALAVNLVADKSIYVFDEATSNIDIESESIIMSNIKQLSQDKVVIVISHRLANIVGADKIYYLDNGRIEEKGNHNDLCEQKGKYCNLFDTQKNLEQGYMLEEV